MEDDDDDFYGSAEPSGQEQAGVEPNQAHDFPIKTENGGDNEEDDDDEDDSDEDDVEFTLEKPEGVKTEQRQPSKATPVPGLDRPSSTTAPPEQQTQAPRRASGSVAPTQAHSANGTTLTYNGRPGSDFPAPHTSNLDINAIPIWPGTGKPLTSLDIDADLAESTKPWRLPGTDQTDYFNYGFDEYAWAQYCIRQQSMRKEIGEQREADGKLQAMFGGGPGPGAGGQGAGAGGPGGPGMGGPQGMGGPPGMPDPDQLMQQMMASGMNPAEMDFNQFMAMAGQMGGGGPGGPPSGPAAMQGGFGNSVSPANGGQGFAPPNGPSGGGMEGYSAQQMAMMQDGQQHGGQQHGGHMGGGGGRGRGRRGRGYY